MNTNTNSEPRGSLFNSANLLRASAFILLGLIIVQAGRLGSGWSRTASADVVSRVGDLTALAVTAQSSEDVLVVLDGRNELLFAYRLKNRDVLEFLTRRELPALFAEAERLGPGKGK